MPILIDGTNLLHSLPDPSARRDDVRRAVLNACRHEHRRATVVFDGPPPDGTPNRESLGSVTVMYSGSKSADDVIIQLLPRGREARNWVVVTNDGQLQQRAMTRGATIRTLPEWKARRRQLPSYVPSEPKLSSQEIAEWEEYFSGRREEER